jgi:hypothetical protein
MDWIKQNPKIVAAAGAFVVAVLLLFVVNSKLSAGVEEAAAKRTQSASSLNVAAQPVTYNGQRVYPNDDLIALEQQRVDNIQQELADVQSLSSRFSINGFEPLRFTDSSGSTMDAFPVPDGLRDRGLLRYDVSQAFLDARDALTAPYRIATPVSQAAFDAEIASETERIRYTPAFTGLDAERRTETTLAAMARASLLGRLRRIGSAGQLMYVEPNAMRFSITEASESVSMDDLWRAQIDLWIMQDILAAINETNLAAVDGLDPAEVSVADSAVKIVQAIHVQGYVPQAGDTVTGRSCNREYDVVNYTVSVVMPTEYIELLMANIMSRNYHTILNVSYQVYPVLADSMYDLGDDALARVELTGELLLLTDWERDLMPWEFMDDDTNIPASALRDVDRERIRSEQD